MSSDTHRPKNRKKATVIVTTVLLLLIVLPFSFLTVYVSGYDTIFPNVYVGELNLSGKTEAEAFSLLQDIYNPSKINGVTFSLSCEDTREELSAEALGITYQNRETVNAALAVGNSKNPFTRAITFLLQAMGSTSIDPVITYNHDLLSQTIDKTATPYEVEPVGYTFEIEPDSVTIHAPVAGVKVDRNAITQQVETQIRNRAFADIVLEPITTPAEPLNLDEFYTWLTSPAENAYYAKGDDGKVSVTREKLQCSVDKDMVKQAIARIEESGSTTESFAVTTTEPEVLSLALKENLYKDKLGSYTTYYSGTAARNNNVRLATERVNGYELMPGEEFSYDKTILPRTAANGYQAAPVYVGNKVESGMGGGICQPSSTLYGAALYANLEILERHNHSMMVSYMPAGLDATISQGALDLRLKNSTSYPVKFSAQASGGVLTFSIWGYNPDQISVEIVRSGGGYSYSATRIVKKNGEVIHREPLGTSRYVPPEPSETPAPTETAEPEETPAPTETAPAVSTDVPTGTGTEAPTPTVSAPEPTVTPTPAPTQATDTTITE